MLPNLSLYLTCPILLPCPHKCMCLHLPGFPLHLVLSSPAHPGCICTACWGGHWGWRLHWSCLSHTQPRLRGQWAQQGAGAGNGAEVPRRPLGDGERAGEFLALLKSVLALPCRTEKYGVLILCNQGKQSMKQGRLLFATCPVSHPC